MEARDISQGYAFQAEAGQNVCKFLPVFKVGQRDLEFLHSTDIERSIQVIRTDDRVAINHNGCGRVCGPAVSIYPRVAHQGVDKAVHTAEARVRCVGE